MKTDVEWSTKEKLAIASYVLSTNDQHWCGSVSRILRPLGEADRPSDWFSPKNCAQQFTALIEEAELIRKSGTEKDFLDDGWSSPESTLEYVVNKLTQERIEQLKKQITNVKTDYKRLLNTSKKIENGEMDDQLDAMTEEMNRKLEAAGKKPSSVTASTQKEPTTKPEQSTTQPPPPTSSTSLHTTVATDDSTTESAVPTTSSSSTQPDGDDDVIIKEDPLTQKIESDEDNADNDAGGRGECEDATPLLTPSPGAVPSPMPAAAPTSNKPVTLHSVLSKLASQTCKSRNEGVKTQLTVEQFEKEPIEDDVITADTRQEDDKIPESVISTDNEESNTVEDEEDIVLAPPKVNLKVKTAPIESASLPEVTKHDITPSSSTTLPDDVYSFENDVTKPANDVITVEKKQKFDESFADKKEENPAVVKPPVIITSEETVISLPPTGDRLTLPLQDDAASSKAESEVDTVSSVGTPSIGGYFESSRPASPALSATSDVDETSYKAWKKSIMILWKQVASHRYASLFLQPVTNDIAPNYTNIVFRPMDLSTLKKNIETNQIRTTSEFQRDLMLMFQNALMYNNQGHDVYKMASEMQEDVMGQVAQFLTTQLIMETNQQPTSKSLRRSTLRRSAASNADSQDGCADTTTTNQESISASPDLLIAMLVGDARSKRHAAIESETRMKKKPE